MPSAIRPVRHTTHRDLTWKPSVGYGFAARSNVTQIAAEELAHAATQYALGFIEGEQPAMVALLGLGAQQNLYVGPDGRWLGDYVPAVFRGYPFKLIAADEGQFALGYDEASGFLAGAGEAEPFFEASGGPADRVQKTLQFLVGVQKGIEAMGRASLRLKEMGLLEPWPIKIRDGNEERPINGLMRVNETRLSELDDTSFLELRRGGVLSVAYAQLLSMANLPRLGQLAQAHAQHAAQSAQREAELKSMFEPLKVDDEIDWEAMLKDD